MHRQITPENVSILNETKNKWSPWPADSLTLQIQFHSEKYVEVEHPLPNRLPPS